MVFHRPSGDSDADSLSCQRLNLPARLGGLRYIDFGGLCQRGDDSQQRRTLTFLEGPIERSRGRRLGGYVLPDERIKRRPANTKDAPLWELRLKSRRETAFPAVGRDLADEIVLLDQSADWGLFWYI